MNSQIFILVSKGKKEKKIMLINAQLSPILATNVQTLQLICTVDVEISRKEK